MVPVSLTALVGATVDVKLSGSRNGGNGARGIALHHRDSCHAQIQAQVVRGALSHNLVIVVNGVVVVTVVHIDVTHGKNGGRGRERIVVAQAVVVADIEGGVTAGRVVDGIAYHPLVGTSVVLKTPIGGFGGILEIANIGQNGWCHIQRRRGVRHAPFAGLAAAIGLHKEGVGGVGSQSRDYKRVGVGGRGDHRGGVARFVVFDVPLALGAGTGPLQGDAVIRGVDAGQAGRTRTCRQRGDAYIIYIYGVG